MSKSTTKYTVIEKKEPIDGYASNHLKFKLSGPDINYVIVNTLTRIKLRINNSKVETFFQIIHNFENKNSIIIFLLNK